jgi:predicted phosphodiesterase
MRLALTSDLHGELPPVPPCDLLLVAGDLCPIDDHSVEAQAEWLHTRFADWLRSVPARRTAFVAGNHDFVFAEAPELLDPSLWNGTYLQDSGLTWEGVAVWGCPWAVKLHGWVFTEEDDLLARRWDHIPPNTRVLVVHGPPHGLGDEVIGRFTGDRLHVGSKSLLAAMARLDKLELVVCGHIHEAYGVYHAPHGVTLVNASLMDHRYRACNPVQVFDLAG